MATATELERGWHDLDSARLVRAVQARPCGQGRRGLLTTWFRAPASEDSDLCSDLGGFRADAVADAVRTAVAYAEHGQRAQP